MEATSLIEGTEDEIAILVRRLHDTQQRLHVLTKGEVDAVTSIEGQSYLLKEAQEELRANEATLREFAATQSSILNALPAHIALIDHEGTILSVNDGWLRFARFNAYKGESCGVGENYLSICDGAFGHSCEEAANVAEGMRAVLSGKIREFSIEYSCHSPGAERWYRLMVNPLEGTGDRGAVVMHLDVTARRLAENAVRTSEASMAAAQHIAHFGSWELDLTDPSDRDANALRWSDEMFRIAGYEPGTVDVNNEMFFRMVPEEEHESIRLAVAEAIEQRRPYSIIHRLIRPNGEECVVHESGQISYDEKSGLPSRIIGTANDITEQRRIEEKMRQQQVELRVLFDLMPAMIWFKDTNNRILRINKRVAETAGKSVSEIEGRPSEEIYPEDAAKFYADDLEVIRSGKPKLGYVETIRGAQGEELWVQTDKVPYHAQDGTVAGIAVMAQDITARRRAEVAIHTVQERLALATKSARMGIWDLDVRTGNIVWDEQMYALYGIDEASSGGVYAAWEQGLHPDDRGSAEADYAAAIGGAGTFDREFRVVWPNGEIHHIEAHGVVLKGADGGADRMIGVNWDITERKRADAALQESEVRYRSLVENMLEGYAYCRLIYENGYPTDFVYLTINRAFESLTGLKNVIGRKVSELIPGIRDVNPELLEVYDRVASTGNPERQEVHVKGLNIWLSISIYSYEKEHFTAVFDNITERKLAENAVRESNDRFLQLASNITDAFWIRSPDMHEVQYVSPAFERIWGRSVQSLYADPEKWSDFIFPDDKERVVGAFAGLTRDAPTLDIEYRILRPNGEVRWVNVRGAQVRDSSDLLVRHTGIVTDITERKLAQDELRFKNTLLSTQQEASIDGILVVDPDKNILTYNKRFVEMWEIPHETIKSRVDRETLTFVVSKVIDPEGFRRTVDQLYDSRRETSRDEIDLIDGRVLDRFSAPLFGPNDEYFGRVWLFRDITERKTHERKIMEMNAALDHRVSERTTELATINVELKRARVEADRANRAKSEFLSHMSHELRTPLNATLGFAQVLQRGKLDARQTECVDNIMTAGSHLLELINEVLEIARIESGRISIVSERISVLEVVRETMDLVRPLAEEMAIHLEIPEPVPAPISILADPTKLKQVLLNLLGNGVKFNRRGGTVALHWDYVTHNRLRFSITDSGPGIHPDQIGRLFTPFERLDAGKQGIAGTGLGLVVTRRLVEAMGGSVGVESEPGKGSTFWFDIPGGPMISQEDHPA